MRKMIDDDNAVTFVEEEISGNYTDGGYSWGEATEDNNPAEGVDKGDRIPIINPAANRNGIAGAPGIGSDALVHFRFDRGSLDAPTSIQFIHEIIHANRIMAGVRNPTFIYTKGDEEWYSLEENEVIEIENVVRNQRKMPLRPMLTRENLLEPYLMNKVEQPPKGVAVYDKPVNR